MQINVRSRQLPVSQIVHGRDAVVLLGRRKEERVAHSKRLEDAFFEEPLALIRDDLQDASQRR